MTCDEAIVLLERALVTAIALGVTAFAAGILLAWLTRPRTK